MIYLQLIRVAQFFLLFGGTVSAALAGMSAERDHVDRFGTRITLVLACLLAVVGLECTLMWYLQHRAV